MSTETSVRIPSAYLAHPFLEIFTPPAIPEINTLRVYDDPDAR
ncbi:MAG TPA: hypothetical protein VJX70_11215 [Candidatus Acidoferrum sp.]|nr:hypothetical protein [Candidatus Acidoferrum sp.]